MVVLMLMLMHVHVHLHVLQLMHMLMHMHMLMRFHMCSMRVHTCKRMKHLHVDESSCKPTKQAWLLVLMEAWPSRDFVL